MDLGRGTLARIDRRILSDLDSDVVYRMVRVPVAGAVWSTWKRYCDAAGISMGRAITALIEHELGSVFGVDVERRLATRTEGLDARDRRLTDRERALMEM